MSAGEKFDRLVAIMARLRAPDGCPWDREQTFDTIKPFLLEETYEVMDAIDARDWQELTSELGDLLLQSFFFAQMASEQRLFSIEDSIEAINAKLIRRHPHVFADGDAKTSGDVKKRWDEIKAEEHEETGRVRKRLLDGITRSQPALAEAAQIASRAAGAGFDWENTEQVIEKLHEELKELEGARQSGDSSHMEDEIGDLLFVIVNIARFLKVDPEQALRRTNRKFRRRFGYLEQKLDDAGKSLQESSIDQMEALWQEAKRSE